MRGGPEGQNPNLKEVQPLPILSVTLSIGLRMLVSLA